MKYILGLSLFLISSCLIAEPQSDVSMSSSQSISSESKYRAKMSQDGSMMWVLNATTGEVKLCKINYGVRLYCGDWSK